MKTKLITALALAAALAFAGRVYAKDDHRGGGGARGHAVAAAHRGGGGARVAAASHARSGGFRGRAIASRRANAARPMRALASNRNLSRNNVAARNVTRNSVAAGNVARHDFASRNVGRNTVAFGGNTNNGRSHYQYAFASHNGWDHGKEYFWQGHHYRWYNNGWFIIDPFPGYAGGYGPGYYGSGYDNSGSVSAGVQAALTQQGYYNGPVDGVIGPRTRAAIAAYQRDNGLPVTGTITPGLLNTLGVG